MFFEYIGSILYALLLRRLPKKALAAVVLISGAVLGYHVIGGGYLGEGWSFVDNGFVWGLLRMLFPYSLGMLMARCFTEKGKEKILDKKYFIPVFLGCAVTLLVLLPMPFVGDTMKPWQNGLYIMALVAGVFPAIVWFAAKAGTGDNRTCSFLGEISYPLYAIHYPIMYLFYQYLGFPDVDCTMTDVWPIALGCFFGSIALAAAFLYLYDKPVRKWLSAKL